MKQLVERLSSLAWENGEWRKEAAVILTHTEDLSSIVTDYIESLSSREQSANDLGSHETSTHYKWLLHRDEDLRFTLWSHEYKPATLRRPGYAEVPHNHRYDLCSIILNGGYVSILYDVSDGVSPISKPVFKPGDILSLRYEEVHALTGIREGTVTLFIEGPRIRNYSTTFPLEGGGHNFVDFGGRRPGFLKALRNSPR